MDTQTQIEGAAKPETNNDLSKADLPDLSSTRSRSKPAAKVEEPVIEEVAKTDTPSEFPYFLDKMDFIPSPYTLDKMGDEIFTTIRVGRKWFDVLSAWLPTSSDYRAETEPGAKPVYLDCYTKDRQPDGSYVTGEKMGRYEVLWVKRIDTLRDAIQRSARTDHMCKAGSPSQMLEEFLKKAYGADKVRVISADPKEFFTVIGLQRVPAEQV